MASYNFTDPLSFLYDDIPHEGFGTSRTIEIVQSNVVNSSNYYLNTSGDLKPTLLKINASLTRYEQRDALHEYAINFLNPDSKNISGLLSVEVENRIPALGKTYRELIIRIYDNETTNMVLIDLSYDLNTGFAETVNVVYTTSDYSFDKVSTVYLETFYSTSGTDLSALFAFINIFSVAALIVAIPTIYFKGQQKKIETTDQTKQNFGEIDT